MTLENILKEYNIKSSIQPFGNGHINDTYLLPDAGCILQRINTSIFKDPAALMENVVAVTEYLKKHDPAHITLSVVKTKMNQLFYQTPEGDCYRVYQYIEYTRTIESNATEADLYQAGACLGHFHKVLCDFPAEMLHETIPDFHHTPKRVDALKDAIEKNIAGRAAEIKKEIEFALKYHVEASIIVNYMSTHDIPLRVTHNDTKINNYLFEANGSKAICLIDLDTVMPGSLLYDIGDALRLGGSTAAEDEVDLENVHFKEQAFAAFVKGYLTEMGDSLTEKERELLPFSVRLITYEQGVRFLTDYLNGDTYYKTSYPNHNLDRARNQFKLVAELKAKESLMKGLII